jgi:diguanylate cyclase (GGDEF)-like protein/PAS domain S-box-containing protein
MKWSNNLQFYAAITIVFILIALLALFCFKQYQQHEVKLKESQLLLETIFDQNFHYIGIFDQAGALVSCNQKLQQLIYTQGVNLNLPLWQHECWAAESAQQMACYFAENHFVDQNQNRVELEVKLWNADLGNLVLRLSLKTFYLSRSDAVQIMFEASDITWRKSAESKLLQREISINHYYDQQPVMMLTLNTQSRIQQVNSFACQLLGYPAANLYGQPINILYKEAETPPPRQALLQPKSMIDGVWRREVEYRHVRGNSIWVRENIKLLSDTGDILIVGEDITENRQLANRLAYQARYDLLTNTYNRNQFEIELAEALVETQDGLRSHAMFYLDLDQLKVLNDTAGHDAGDAAIQFCADMLREILPYNTVLARLGGDEFAVLLKDCTERDARLVAKQIVQIIAAEPFIWERLKIHLTCSIGIRLIDQTATSPQMVHAQADTACHAAKEDGRNRVNLYEQDNEDLRRRQLEMECVNLVHKALANDGVEIFAQQILSLKGQSGMHFEVLVRIKNELGDYISPGVFVPASERYNMAHLLDRQVVDQTLIWLECHPIEQQNLGLCSINLSGQSIGNPEFVDFLLTRLRETSVSCLKLCFEITETAAMSNIKQAMILFSALKQLGCKIALDDFGSGVSSFGYLKKIPVDIVKIDGLFVRDIVDDEMDRLMVRSINELAQKMGKLTVAEFVESEAILTLLGDMGIDYAQGYIINKPQPISSLVEQLMEEIY